MPGAMDGKAALLKRSGASGDQGDAPILVIPAKAGIQLPFLALKETEEAGSPLSRG